MRPLPRLSMKCHLCHEEFENVRGLKNHLASAPHRRLAVICPWCPEERSFRRAVDLKDHTKITHRRKFDSVPEHFLSENNAYWMAFHPSDYVKVIRPSDEGAEEAIKARAEIRSFVHKLKNSSRSIEEWEEGWRLNKNVPTKRGYSPATPHVYDDSSIKSVTLTPGSTNAIFVLDLERQVQWYKVDIDDSIFQDQRNIEALCRRMATVKDKVGGVPEIKDEIEEDKVIVVKEAFSKKLGIKEDFINKIRKVTINFGSKKCRRSITPLPTPSTSSIELGIDTNSNGSFSDCDPEDDRRDEKREEILRKIKERKEQLKEKDDIVRAEIEKVEKKNEERKQRKEEEEMVKREVEKAKQKEERKRRKEEEEERVDREIEEVKQIIESKKLKENEEKLRIELAEAQKKDQERKRIKEGLAKQQIPEEDLKSRALVLLKQGGMPLYPAARREWDQDESISLCKDPLVRWPPINWKILSEEDKFTAWMYVSSFLEAKSGRPMITNQGELLDKYAILALPGTMITKGKSHSHLRLANFNIIKDIACGKLSGSNAHNYLLSYETAAQVRNADIDWLLQLCKDIPLRLTLAADE